MSTPLVVTCQSCGVRAVVDGEVMPCIGCDGTTFIVDGPLTPFPYRPILLTDNHNGWGFPLTVLDQQFLSSLHISSSQ